MIDIYIQPRQALDLYGYQFARFSEKGFPKFIDWDALLKHWALQLHWITYSRLFAMDPFADVTLFRFVLFVPKKIKHHRSIYYAEFY